MRGLGKGNRGLTQTIDWTLVIYYLLLVTIGLVNIYASIHSSEPSSIFDFGCRSGKQFVWIMTAFAIAIIILFVLNPRVYEGLSVPIYLFVLALLIAVIFLGIEVKGSRSWFAFGSIRFQPAEISKISTSLLLATFMSQQGYKIGRAKDFIITALIIMVPMLIIVLQSETGSALVYVGFIFMLYREGLSGWLIFLIGVAILSFILTLTASAYVAVLVIFGLASLCSSLYAGKIKWWLILGVPLIVLLAFIPHLMELWSNHILGPEGVEALAAAEGNYAAAGLDIPFPDKINPLYILLAVIALLIPFSLYTAYRERHSFTPLAIVSMVAGFLLVFSADIIFNNVLQPHQRKRIEVLLGMKEDPTGVGYNVNQSMIAIGSGGLTGKGYLNGTQTAYGFVPEQSTDFIFCTIGEEWGFLGASAVIILYVLMICRIIRDAERSRESFTRIYGYCVACCIFMHLFINVGMTIGIMPVIGIPLPLVSYGGSSLWGFTALIFIFISLYKNEKKYF